MKGAPGTCLPLPRADGFVTREPRQVGAPLRGGGPLPGTVCPWAPRRVVATHHHCQGASRDKQNSLWNNSRQRLPCVPPALLASRRAGVVGLGCPQGDSLHIPSPQVVRSPGIPTSPSQGALPPLGHPEDQRQLLAVVESEQPSSAAERLHRQVLSPKSLFWEKNASSETLGSCKGWAGRSQGCGGTGCVAAALHRSSSMTSTQAAGGTGGCWAHARAWQERRCRQPSPTAHQGARTLQSI